MKRLASARGPSLFDGAPRVYRGNRGGCLGGRRWRWYEQKRLGWNEGYRILLRIEARFCEQREAAPEAQRVLAVCRRLVLVEMGYRVG